MENPFLLTNLHGLFFTWQKAINPQATWAHGTGALLKEFG